MKKFSGKFIGTGAGIYIGLGFQPTRVLLRNMTDADQATIIWTKFGESTVTACDGILYQENTKVAQTNLTVGAGVKRYAGGDLISAAAATHIIPVSMIPAMAGDMRNKGTLGIADTWTLDTTANRTGHLNKGINTTYVGVGSVMLVSPWDRIVGDEEEATIVAITNDGDAADEITLSRAVASGRVHGITYKYSFGQAPAGTVMPPGIYVAEATYVNESGDLVYIEAESEE
jgi:hypothetical protein